MEKKLSAEDCEKLVMFKKRQWVFGSVLEKRKAIDYWAVPESGRHWKSCSKCSVSLTGDPWISPKFCEFWPGSPGQPFKVLQNSGIPQDFEWAGFGILQKLLLSFLENWVSSIGGVWIISGMAHYIFGRVFNQFTFSMNFFEHFPKTSLECSEDFKQAINSLITGWTAYTKM